MATYTEEFAFDYPVDNVLSALAEVASSMNWQVRVLEDRLVIQETQQILSFGWAATIEVTEQETTEATKSKLRMYAHNFGWGPIQRRHLKTQVQELQNNVRLALMEPRTISSPGSVRSTVAGLLDAISNASATNERESLDQQLAHLANLHSQGVLSEEEFQKAKRKLLDSRG